MAQWDWLTKPEQPYTWRFARNVIAKGLVLFVIVNALFAVLNPVPLLGRLSWYNVLVPGRDRLPYGENPDQSYNLSLQNLDAMFAAHEIAGTRKAADEYRVLLIGDSSVWGVLLKPDETLSAYLNAAHYRTANGKHIRVYNIGYPIQSLAKDVLLLNYAMRYQPDLIIWMLTLESFAPNQQMESFLVKQNPDLVRPLISAYNLKSISPNDPKFSDPSLLERTIVGQRRPLADILRLQLYGPTWAITNVDQRYPKFFEPRQENFDPDLSWQGFKPDQQLTTDNLAFDVLQAGVSIAGKVPVILINEPIFISHGVNSDLRYDFFYPRWAYDNYLRLLQNTNIVNLWNTIPSDQYTDSAVHLTPAGSHQLADKVGEILMQRINGK
jgi:hypothetical protein